MPKPNNTLTTAKLLAATRGRTFKHCEFCGNSIITSACYCPECARLTGYGMRTAVKQFVPANDTQVPQSYRSNDHSGYSDRIPSGKFPAGRKERV
jgi:hypothetical protein